MRRERGHLHSVPVRGGTRDRFRTDVAAGARLILDHGLLPPHFREPRGEQAAADVRSHASRERYDKAYETRRP